MSYQKLTTDSIILLEFVKPLIKAGETILDIGCGTGEIDLTLAEQTNCAVTGIDINSESINIANENLKQKSECKSDTIKINFINHSLSDYAGEKSNHGKFHRIISNPPFYPIDKSRQPQSDARKIARQDTELKLEEFFQCSFKLLNHKGYLDFIFIPQRLGEIFKLAEQYKFSVSNIKPVYTKVNSNAKRIVVECRKSSKTELKISEFMLFESPLSF